MPIVDPEKRRAYARAWMRRRRTEWMDANGPCALCGSRERLELDHIDPALKISHNVWSWAKERREAELAKCRVLCRTCHAKRHKLESTHGSRRMFRYHGCRCDVCWLANLKRRRIQRERRKHREAA